MRKLLCVFVVWVGCSSYSAIYIDWAAGLLNHLSNDQRLLLTFDAGWRAHLWQKKKIIIERQSIQRVSEWERTCLHDNDEKRGERERDGDIDNASLWTKRERRCHYALLPLNCLLFLDFFSPLFHLFASLFVLVYMRSIVLVDLFAAFVRVYLRRCI